MKDSGDKIALLRTMFDRAVEVADPMRVVPQHLPERPSGRVIVIGAGKASARMAEAVETVWDQAEGLVITRYGYGRPTHGIDIVEAAHPVPDEAGIQATEAMLQRLEGLTEDDLVLVLISGGGSALLCAPAAPLTLAEKQSLHQALLRSGAPIGDMNIVRKHLSSVKGGQLAAHAYPARVVALLISDVTGDDPRAIASGPTAGDETSAADARALLESLAIPVTQSMEAALQASAVVAPGDVRLFNTQNIVVAAPSQSLLAAEEIARAAGADVVSLGSDLEGEAKEAARAQVEQALTLQKTLQPGDKPIVLMSGGECTVTGAMGANGGPNAEFMLAAAIALDGAEGIYGIACDTDGVDGAAEVAGAIITPATLATARAAGIDPEIALQTHESHSFFAAIDAQVVTGPTLTNVNDFRAFLILPAGAD